MDPFPLVVAADVVLLFWLLVAALKQNKVI